MVSVAFLHMGAGQGAQCSEYCHILSLCFFQQRLKFGDQPVKRAGIAEYRDGATRAEQRSKGCPQRCECILEGREQAEGKQDIFCPGISAAKQLCTERRGFTCPFGQQVHGPREEYILCRQPAHLLDEHGLLVSHKHIICLESVGVTKRQCNGTQVGNRHGETLLIPLQHLAEV